MMTATFDLYPLRFRVRPRRKAPVTANLLRGAFGSALKQVNEEAYRRYFAPRWPANSGPSGLSDPPRPFVFRLLSPLEVGVNVFATRELASDAFIEAMHGISAFEIETVTGTELLRLPLSDAGSEVERVRIRFVTPAELKGADQPDFGTLAARIRDRISTLREVYGPGPLDLDFKAFGERAARIHTTRCELTRVAAERVSRATGRRHSLGGFTGVAEYQGDLGEFLPYLEIARWTGVGRQTVWGKGEIAYETF